MYYYFRTNEFFEFGKSTMYGVAGLKRVNADSLRSKYLPIPPPLEQETIVRYIERQSSRIDGVVADIQEQIEKLKEYRQSIISEAVTGKVAL